jgi:hypothetical protein
LSSSLNFVSVESSHCFVEAERRGSAEVEDAGQTVLRVRDACYGGVVTKKDRERAIRVCAGWP